MGNIIHIDRIVMKTAAFTPVLLLVPVHLHM